jgi:septum formation topological specificity factor MinE
MRLQSTYRKVGFDGDGTPIYGWVTEDLDLMPDTYMVRLDGAVHSFPVKEWLAIHNGEADADIPILRYALRQWVAKWGVTQRHLEFERQLNQANHKLIEELREEVESLVERNKELERANLTFATEEFQKSDDLEAVVKVKRGGRKRRTNTAEG